MCDGEDCVDLDALDIDSKTLGTWIAHCIEKHVKRGVEPKMTREQCIAAGHSKLRKGEVSRDSNSRYIFVAAINEWIDIDIEQDAFRGEMIGKFQAPDIGWLKNWLKQTKRIDPGDVIIKTTREKALRSGWILFAVYKKARSFTEHGLKRVK